jgi:hypothetical protein
MSFGKGLKQAQLKIKLISFPLNLIVFKNKNYIFEVIINLLTCYDEILNTGNLKYISIKINYF